MTHMALLTGPERRRRWSEDDRVRVLAVSFAPGAVVADVARQFDVSTSLIYKWRKTCLAAAAPSFAPAMVVDAPGPATGRAQVPAILVELPAGARVHIAASAPSALVTATLGTFLQHARRGACLARLTRAPAIRHPRPSGSRTSHSPRAPARPRQIGKLWVRSVAISA